MKNSKPTKKAKPKPTPKPKPRAKVKSTTSRAAGKKSISRRRPGSAPASETAAAPKSLDPKKVFENLLASSEGFKTGPRVESLINLEYLNGERPPVYTQPISIKLTNLTDEKLFNVKVFNLDFEKQDKIEYSNIIKNLTYKELLYQLPDSENAFKIGRVQCVSEGDYERFKLRQMNAKYYFVTNALNGNSGTTSFDPIISPFQVQKNICVSDLVFGIHRGAQLQLQYLMPEVSVTFYFFPIK